MPRPLPAPAALAQTRRRPAGPARPPAPRYKEAEGAEEEPQAVDGGSVDEKERLEEQLEASRTGVSDEPTQVRGACAGLGVLGSWVCGWGMVFLVGRAVATAGYKVGSLRHVPRACVARRCKRLLPCGCPMETPRRPR